MSINKFRRNGWIRCPECGTEPKQTRPDDDAATGKTDWTWKYECPECGESISGRIRG